ncbi:chymotrypsin-1-like [Prorops nasuta]|uniref:chymotrypsin-1-like n=1 Tax=Prorops nasuta TaxID=863751 RepID=UPI0034CEC9CA
MTNLISVKIIFVSNSELLTTTTLTIAEFTVNYLKNNTNFLLNRIKLIYYQHVRRFIINIDNTQLEKKRISEKMNTVYKFINLFLLFYTISVESRFTPRIVEGSDAKPGQFPYVASLRITETLRHTCGASIVTNQHILTAAHCVSGNKPDDFFVVTGSIWLEKGGSTHKIQEIRVHEDYVGIRDNWKNDIAVLKLSKPIQLNAETQILPLPTSNVSLDTICTISGWGKLSANNYTLPSVMQTTNQSIIPITECEDGYHFKLGDGRLCAMMGSGLESGICQGDSGGPLVCNGKHHGIVSFNIPCAVGVPDVYTKVIYYANWIEKHIQDFDKI